MPSSQDQQEHNLVENIWFITACGEGKHKP